MHDGEGPEAGERNRTKGLLTKDAQAPEGPLKSGASSTTSSEESTESSGAPRSKLILWCHDLMSAARKARVANEELLAVTQAGEMSGVPRRGASEAALEVALKALGIEVASYDELVTGSSRTDADTGQSDPNIWPHPRNTALNVEFPKVETHSPYPQPRQDATMLVGGSPGAREVDKLNRGASAAEPDWVRPESSLPCGWVRVRGDSRQVQSDLFPLERDRYLALACVSLDDLRRWRDLKWLSFDAAGLDTLPDPLWHEILFVRNLVRSGLSDEWIQRLLDGLEPPYRYDPLRTVYSFALGWVQIPPITEDSTDAFVAEHLPRWIAEKALFNDLAPLLELHSSIAFEIARARAREKRDSTDVEEGE
jgi:hypothetical protein